MKTERSDAPIRARGTQTRQLPTARRLVIAAERAGRRRSPLHFLITVDVTVARSMMAMAPEASSFTTFIAASVARTAAEDPDIHAYRDWSGRLATHRHVDVVIPLRIPTEQGYRLIPHVMHDADIREVPDLTRELKAAHDAGEGTDLARLLDRFSWAMRVPGLLRGAYAVMDRTPALRRRIGTVLVTTVGMPGVGEAFGIGVQSLMPLQVVIGNITKRRHTMGNLIGEHEVVNLTVTADHTVIDAACAARFAARLSTAIEHAEVLPHPAAGQPTPPADPAEQTAGLTTASTP
jgi:pyruvate/2-oxoglutarate dehydrogenase complex dihydrolipoamide acyltransferase (E2) component